MARRIYRVWNGATGALTAAYAPVTTGTTLKTMQQIKPVGHTPVIGYGWRFDAIPTAVIKVELLTTGTVNATVTAYVTGDLTRADPLLTSTAPLTMATSGSGYTSNGTEGSITSTRLFDYRLSWEQSFDVQLPLDREYACGPSDYLRLRMTTAVAINAVTYIDLEE